MRVTRWEKGTTTILPRGASGALWSAPRERYSNVAGFQLWETTLDQVREALGPTETVKAGDASLALTSICYRVHSVYVNFYSGEMGGGVKLEGIGISLAPPHAKCSVPANPERIGKLQANGLKLGMTKREFTAAAPAEVSWDQDAAFSYKITQRTPASSPKTIKEEAGSNVTSIGAQFAAGRAVMFYIARHEE